MSRDLEVRGVWNNYEGLPGDFSKRLDQVLANTTDYAVFTNGKFDWTTGGHSENVYLDAWTTYARTPYDVNASGGWALENCCASQGTIHPGGGLNGTRSAHAKDWENTWEACSWMAATVSRDAETQVGAGARHDDEASDDDGPPKLIPRVEVAPPADARVMHGSASMAPRCSPPRASAPRWPASWAPQTASPICVGPSSRPSSSALASFSPCGLHWSYRTRVTWEQTIRSKLRSPKPEPTQPTTLSQHLPLPRAAKR